MTFSGETTALSAVSCDVSGTSSFGFTSSGEATSGGEATGPIESTYTETGTVQVGPQAPDPAAFGGAIPVGQVLDVRAAFEIRSATDEVLVTGTKAADRAAAGGRRRRWLVQPSVGLPGLHHRGRERNLCYDAAFAGGGTERGTARLLLQAAGGDLVYFLENFFPGSPQATCPPLLPTSKQECKKGGAFEDSDQFANQGDCVSFVATGGRNAPGRHRSK